MNYIEDSNLTEEQENLKWNVYSEVEWEPDSDIKAVLKSLLADICE
jgi:hypothetical protein